MEEEKLRETIKALEEKLSQQEERYDRLKREHVACKARSRIDKNRISELKEKSNSQSMDVPTEYVLQHNFKKHSYSLWMWKEDVPILIKTDVYTDETRADAEKLYKELLRQLEKKLIRDMDGDDNLPF